MCVTVNECEARLCWKRTECAANTFHLGQMIAKAAVHREVKDGKEVVQFS